MAEVRIEKKEWFDCCRSSKFAEKMESAFPFGSFHDAAATARDIWFNKLEVTAWLEAFSAHPQIGQSPSSVAQSHASAQWSKAEQSTAFATATSSSLLELSDWNARYLQKFGFIFLICASGRTISEILAELKKRYFNRPIIEFEIAAQEQMKITELRLVKLFSAKGESSNTVQPFPSLLVNMTQEDRVSIIGGHVTAASKSLAGKTPETSQRTRPPITAHVLDVSRGCPAAGVEIRLDMLDGTQPHPFFGEIDTLKWVFQGSSVTNNDGRSGQLMSILDAVKPGIYRISFNTGKYCPDGFFPYVSIVFAIREAQKWEHFHVPLLLSPFSFSTYRGS